MQDDRPVADPPLWKAVPRWWRSHVIRGIGHQAVVERVREDDGWSPRYAFMILMSAGIAGRSCAGECRIRGYFSSAYWTVSVTDALTWPGSTGVLATASALKRALCIIGMGGWPPLLLSLIDTSRAERKPAAWA